MSLKKETELQQVRSAHFVENNSTVGKPGDLPLHRIRERSGSARKGLLANTSPMGRFVLTVVRDVK